jgi:GntR family transcriptional regulator
VPAIFSVDPRSGVPIYLQVIEQVKRAIALGTLAPGEQLPTVKSLALGLTVNPNTIARAYRDLERERVIETSPGRGSFVPSGEAQRDSQRAATDVAEKALAEAVRTARSFGLDRAAVRVLAERALDRWFPDGTVDGEE